MKRNKYGVITEINSGKTYTSLNEVCNTLKLNKNTLYKKFRSIDINKPYLIEIDNFKFSKAINIDTTLAYNKKQNKQGFQKAKEVVEMYSKKTFNSINNCCKFYNLKPSTLAENLSKKGYYKNDSVFVCLKDNIDNEEITKLLENNFTENKKNNYEMLISNSGAVFILKNDNIVKKCISAKDLLESIKVKEIIL